MVHFLGHLSYLQSIDLRKCLTPDSVDRVRPFTQNERTQQVLLPANNPMQEQLKDLQNFTATNLMKKTSIMKFNFSRTNDFPPELTIEGFQNNLQVINQTRLLGVVLSSDLKWSANTDFICTKAIKKMWTLRRMKLLDVEPLLILDVYEKEIRSVLELAVPAWHSGLTLRQSSDIERVQRIALNNILNDITTGKSECSYDMA